MIGHPGLELDGDLATGGLGDLASVDRRRADRRVVGVDVGAVERGTQDAAGRADVGELLADLLAGNLEILTGGTTTMLPYIKSGRLRGLAISSTKRLAAAPDIPSYTEQGYPTLNFNLWHGMIGPKGIPDAIVGKLNAERRRTRASAEIDNAR